MQKHAISVLFISVYCKHITIIGCLTDKRWLAITKKKINCLGNLTRPTYDRRMDIRKRFVLVSTGTMLIFFFLTNWYSTKFWIQKNASLPRLVSTAMLLESQQIWLQVCTPTQMGWIQDSEWAKEKNTTEVSSAMHKGEPVHVQLRKRMRSVRMCRN